MPFDIGSKAFGVSCKPRWEGRVPTNDLKMTTSGLTLGANDGYARYCSFSDINPHLPQLTGNEPDCRGPSPGDPNENSEKLHDPTASLPSSNLNIPTSWKDKKITTTNNCKEWEYGEFKPADDMKKLEKLKTVVLFARMTVRSNKYYSRKCKPIDDTENFNTMFYKQPLHIIQHKNREYPQWNEPMNDPQIYTFNLPPGTWVDHHQNLRGFPLGVYVKK